MEDIIEHLRELAESVAVPLALPTEDDLVVVEEEILIPLPHDFRVFLMEVSDVITGNIEPATAADPRSHTYLPEMAALAWDIGLPREYIPICEYEGGYACIAQDGKVTFWRSGEIHGEGWEDIWWWAREVWLDNSI